jgi:hypothetical protein
LAIVDYVKWGLESETSLYSRIITDPKIAAPTAVPTVDITVTAVHTVTAPEAVTCTPFIDVIIRELQSSVLKFNRSVLEHN